MPAEAASRRDLIQFARRLHADGLTAGTSGNLSVRIGRSACVITPSGMRYQELTPSDLVAVSLNGKPRARRRKPSTDTPVHLAIYRAQPDVGAVIHTHSPYATAFAVLERPIPPFLVEVAGYLGGAVPVLAYQPEPASDLAGRVVRGLDRGRALLLGHHGVIAVGESLEKAYTASLLVEHGARVALLASLLGRPADLPESEIAALHRFLHEEYGQRKTARSKT